MDFELTREQKTIQKAVRAFVKGEFDKDTILNLEKKHDYPETLWKTAAELGFVGIHFPETYSGQGFGVFENVLVTEELCRGDSSVGTCITMADFASEIILHRGSEELKASWLPGVAEGEMLSCGAFLEPHNGYDISSINTTAVKTDDEWIINGAKTFIKNGGPMAGYYIVLCRTDPDATLANKGLSAILVEADRPGIIAKDIGNKMGNRMMYTAEINFDQVRVPLSNLIGKKNRGFSYVNEFFKKSHILIAAQALGIAQGAFERALEYVKKREQFGKKIAQFQITRHKIAEMAAKIDMSRLLVYKAALKFDKGRAESKLSSMAKMCATRTAVEVADEAIQLLGGYGYMLEYEIERFYRDAKMSELYDGNNNIQKDIIASAVIGRIR